MENFKQPEEVLSNTLCIVVYQLNLTFVGFLFCCLCLISDNRGRAPFRTNVRSGEADMCYQQQMEGFVPFRMDRFTRWALISPWPEEDVSLSFVSINSETKILSDLNPANKDPLFFIYFFAVFWTSVSHSTCLVFPFFLTHFRLVEGAKLSELEIPLGLFFSCFSFSFFFLSQNKQTISISALI